MRYLAIDLGGKRTGLAVGDDQTGQAGPLGLVEEAKTEALCKAILKAIEEQGAEALVVGVPYNMDGSTGAGAKRSLAFAQTLRERTGLEVFCCDERLTSSAAEGRLNRSGYTHKQKKARRDAIAATVILQDFLEGRAREKKP